MDGVVNFLAGFSAALVLASLVEYFAHRLMHDGKLLKLRHAKHQLMEQGA